MTRAAGVPLGLVAHVEHVRDVAGIDHVGLGGDYDGVTTLPEGLEDVSRYPRLLEALADRGWSARDLAKLTCRNMLRMMRAIEDVATRFVGVLTGHPRGPRWEGEGGEGGGEGGGERGGWWGGGVVGRRLRAQMP